jgi:spoIIIJ-associated protein
MDKVRVKGKTIEEAIEGALKILGLKREQIEYSIISEGKSGMLGIIGGEEAEVEVRKRLTRAQAGEEFLQGILDHMKIMAIAEGNEEDGRVGLNIKGEDLGNIIGKDGNTLAALQNIVSAALSHRFAERVRVNLDAGGYKEKKANALQRLAKDAAKDVASSGQEKILPPMNAAERRIVHIALKDEEKVKTFSRGEGPDRRLVIAPK